MLGDAQLRSQLKQITETSVFQQIARVKELKDEHAHTVEPVHDAEGREVPPFGTCFAFALDLHKDTAYRHIAECDAVEKLERFFASPEFMSWLLEHERLKRRSPTAPIEGALVLYFDGNGDPVHAGIGLHDGRVRSKWGIGWAWEHQTWEVPSSYGNDVAFYERPTADQACDAFLDWLCEQPDFPAFAAKFGFGDLINSISS